jgi:cysteine desulfurase
VIFTSGASEALAIGLGRAKAERRIVSAVEHDAVFRAAPDDAEVVPVGKYALLDLDKLEEALARPGNALVVLQTVNPETGTVVFHDHGQGNAIAEMIRDQGGLLLCDCSQSAGKLELTKADMAVVSAHKLGGPIGIGALLVRDFAMLEPRGGQERGYRPGTENLPAALGFAAALEAGGQESWQTTADERQSLQLWLNEIGDLLSIGPVLDYIFAVTHRTLSARSLLIRLDGMGFAVSAGSACSSGSLKPSRVLAAFGLDDETAGRTIRVSLGWSTTAAELDAFRRAWRDLGAS